MKRIISISLMISLACGTQAQVQADTTVIMNADKVIVTSESNYLNVEVLGKENEPDYHFSKTLELNDGINVTSESHSDFDFRLPFTKSGNKRSMDFSFTPTMSVGLVSALGGASHLKTNFGESVEITWHAFFLSINPGSKHWRFDSGLWFNWKNFRMTGDTRFDKVDGNVVMMKYPENADYDFSRVHTLSYQVPLLVEYRPTRQFKFAAGALLNFNGHGNLKTKYAVDGERFKDRDRKVHLNSFTTDFYGVASFSPLRLGAYLKYSPCNVLDTNRGPKFHAISTGLIWNF